MRRRLLQRKCPRSCCPLRTHVGSFDDRLGPQKVSLPGKDRARPATEEISWTQNRRKHGNWGAGRPSGPSSFRRDGAREGERPRLGGCAVGRGPPPPRPGTLRPRLLDPVVSQVSAHMIRTSHPSSDHTGYSGSLSPGKNKGEIRAHIPRSKNISCYERKAKYFPANVRRETNHT